MTPIAPHITAFLQERLPVERRASDNTCESYAYAFKLLFEYAAATLKITPSGLQLEQIDAPLVLGFLNHPRFGSCKVRNAAGCRVDTCFRRHRGPLQEGEFSINR